MEDPVSALNPVSRRPLLDPRFAPGPIARWEWLTLAAVGALALAYWILHYHPYVLPNADFGSFERLAESIFAFEAPESYKRMPLFPFLMGLLATVLPVDRPHLHAALGLNIAFSLGIIAMTFMVCRRLIGPTALVVAGSLLVIGPFQAQCLQPLVEPCLTFLILLALYLFLRQSRWQYLVAALAAITRYEAAALIAIFFVLNVIRERHVRTHLVLAMLASIGFVTWMGLSLSHHSGGNPYLSQMDEQGYSPAWSMAATMFRPVYHKLEYTYFFLPLALIGAVGSWRRFRIPSMAILSFAMMYLIAHIAFGVDKAVYAHPVIWIPPFYMATGAVVIAHWWQNRRSQLIGRIPDFALVAVGAAVLIAAAARSLAILPDDEGIMTHAVYVGFFCALGVLVTTAAFLILRKPSLRAAALAMFIGGAFFVTAKNPFVRYLDSLQSKYYSKYQAYIGTQWLVENTQPHERSLVFSRTAFPAFSTELDVVTFPSLKALTHEELVEELAEREIDYVVYWHRNELPDPGARNYERNLYYYNRYKVWLAEPFMHGEPVRGFQHLATRPLPERTGKPPVQIYRFLGNDADAASPSDQTGQDN